MLSLHLAYRFRMFRTHEVEGTNKNVLLICSSLIFDRVHHMALEVAARKVGFEFTRPLSCCTRKTFRIQISDAINGLLSELSHGKVNQSLSRQKSPRKQAADETFKNSLRLFCCSSIAVNHLAPVYYPQVRA